MDFKRFLNQTVSAISAAAAMGPVDAPERKVKTQRDELAEDKHLTRAQQRRKYSTKGKPFRHVVKFERHGPFWRQEVHGKPDTPPPLVRFYQFRVLHSGKGWRTYTNRVPNAVA